jgi:hypothetical protein
MMDLLDTANYVDMQIKNCVFLGNKVFYSNNYKIQDVHRFAGLDDAGLL